MLIQNWFKHQNEAGRKRLLWLVLFLLPLILIFPLLVKGEEPVKGGVAETAVSHTWSAAPLRLSGFTEADANNQPPIDCNQNPFGSTVELFKEREIFVSLTHTWNSNPPRVTAQTLDRRFHTGYNTMVIGEELPYYDETNSVAQNLSAHTATAADLDGDGETEFVQSFVNGDGDTYLAQHNPDGSASYHLVSTDPHNTLSMSAGNILGEDSEREQAILATVRDTNGALEIMAWDGQVASGNTVNLVGIWRSTETELRYADMVDVVVGNFNNNKKQDIAVTLYNNSNGKTTLLVLEYEAGYQQGSGDNYKSGLKELARDQFSGGVIRDIQVTAARLTADFQDEIIVAGGSYQVSTPGLSPLILLRTYQLEETNQNEIKLVERGDLSWGVDAYATNFSLSAGDVSGNGREEVILGFDAAGAYSEGVGLSIQALEIKDLDTPSPYIDPYKTWFNDYSSTGERDQAERLSIAADDIDNDGRADVLASLDDGRGLEVIWVSPDLFDTQTLPFGHWVDLDPTQLNSRTVIALGDQDNDSIKATYQGQCQRVDEKAVTSAMFIPPYWRNIQEDQPSKGGAIGESRSQTEGEESALAYERSHSTSAYVGVAINTDFMEVSAKGTFGEEYTNSSMKSSGTYTTETTTVQQLGSTDFAVYENTTYYCFGYELEQSGAPITGTVRNCEYIDSTELNTDLDVWDGTRGLHALSISEAMSWAPVARDWASLALFQDDASPQAVSQSSTAAGSVAARAVDGNLSGDPTDNSLATTQQENNPWWQVDLGQSQPLTKIRVWNHTDPAIKGCLDTNVCPSRLSDVYVFVSDTDFNTIPGSEDPNVLLARPDVHAYSMANINQVLSNTLTTADPAGRVTTFLTLQDTQPPQPITGRYVRVHMARNGVLSLAEVQVFGTNHVDPDRYPRDARDSVPDDDLFEVELYNPYTAAWEWVPTRGNMVWSGLRDAQGNPRSTPILVGKTIGLGDSSRLAWSFSSEQVRSEIAATSFSYATRIGYEIDVSAGYIGQIQAGYGEEWSFGTTAENTHTTSWGQAFEVGGEMQGFPTNGYNGQTWVDKCNYQMRPYMYEVTELSSFGAVHRYPVLDYVVPHGVSPNNLDRTQDLSDCRNGNQTSSTPQTNNDQAHMFTGESAILAVLGNDTGNNLHLTGVGTPQNGTATFTERSIIYTPNVGFIGDDTFTYTVSDGTTTTQGSVTVTVSKRFIYLPAVIR